MSASIAGPTPGGVPERSGGPELMVTAIVNDSGALPARRGRAQLWAYGQALHACAEGEAGAAALCAFGSGHAVLALAGRFGATELGRLQRLVPHIRRLAENTLIIDLSGIRDCSHRLVRWIGHMRIRRLIDGGHVELHHCPLELAEEMTRVGVGVGVVVDPSDTPTDGVSDPCGDGDLEGFLILFPPAATGPKRESCEDPR